MKQRKPKPRTARSRSLRSPRPFRLRPNHACPSPAIATGEENELLPPPVCYFPPRMNSPISFDTFTNDGTWL